MYGLRHPIAFTQDLYRALAIAIVGLPAGARRVDAYLGPLPVGSVCLSRTPRGHVWLHELAVSPNHRKRGVASALVLATVHLLERDAGHGTVRLRVFHPAHPASKRIAATVAAHGALDFDDPTAVAEVIAALSERVNTKDTRFVFDLRTVNGDLGFARART